MTFSNDIFRWKYMIAIYNIVFVDNFVGNYKML